MGDKSKIEWTEASWNPVVGCSLVSQGCKNCYAMRQARRLEGFGQKQYQGLTHIVNGHPVWNGTVRLVEDALELPLHWRRPRRIFVNSMSDLFHEALTDAQIDQVFAVMAACPQHVFQVLTKRPGRARDYFRGLGTQAQAAERLSWALDEDGGGIYSEEFECRVANAINGVLGEGYNAGWPLSNLWLGTSVEDQATADMRIPLLLETPAAVRWISAEPLLGPIDLRPRPRHDMCLLEHPHAGACKTRGLDWVVAGGESGPGARPLHPAWARSLRDQCAAAGVPFFFKQRGAWTDLTPPLLTAIERQHKFADGLLMHCVGKKAAGRLLDGREHNDYPAVQTPAKAAHA